MNCVTETIHLPVNFGFYAFIQVLKYLFQMKMYRLHHVEPDLL